jgi:hypothetical protein
LVSYIQIPQLWSACIPEDAVVLDNRKTAIASLEKKKQDNASHAAATSAAKKKAKEKGSEQDSSHTKKRQRTEVSDEVTNSSMRVGDRDNAVVEDELPMPCADDHPGTDVPFSLHPDDPGNFLKLSAALLLLAKRSVSYQEITDADMLLRGYCTELISVSINSCIESSHLV